MEIIDSVEQVWKFISPLVGIIFILSTFILKKSLKDIDNLKSSKASGRSLDQLREDTAKDIQDIKDLIKDINHLHEKFSERAEDRMATNDHVKVIERDVRRLQDDVGRIDSDMIKHMETAIERLRADMADRLKLMTSLLDRK